MKKIYLFLAVFILIVLWFFRPFLLEGKYPIPSDTIVGLYHPFRDIYAETNPNGIPYKNFLITDPVRQQYPWRLLAVEIWKKGELPLWNPYTFSGTPLLANFQSAVFYPLNILLFIGPFPVMWSLLVMLQPLLAGIFLFFFLRNLKVDELGSLFGAISYAFSGFMIAWLEWNTLGHVAVWLPLIMLSIDKITERFRLSWFGIMLFAAAAQFFAGHLQTLFYAIVFSGFYTLLRLHEHTRGTLLSKKYVLAFLEKAIPFIIFEFLILTITAIQWLPTLTYILESGRDVDQVLWQQEGWFIPWQHLIQFVAPDFFGNPTTLNYWGVWNYGELVGYIGLIPLVFALYALISKSSRTVVFFAVIAGLSLLLALPTPLAKLPFILDIPLLSTSQPTRLLFLIDFSLAVLAAFGLDSFIKAKDKKAVLIPGLFLLSIFGLLWLSVLGIVPVNIPADSLQTAKRNLILPTVLLLTGGGLVVLYLVLRNKTLRLFLLAGLFLLTVFDLVRFAEKFTPFTANEYLFPDERILSYLSELDEPVRIMATDSRIMPPNFTLPYHIQTVDGYDPLYLKRYGELISANQRNEPNITPPFGFNRIITPHDVSAPLNNLLGITHILSFDELTQEGVTKIMEHGQTKLYKNESVLPRAFFVSAVQEVSSKEEAIQSLFKHSDNLDEIAIIEQQKGKVFSLSGKLEKGKVALVSSEENRVVVKTENRDIGFLVLTDSYYPTWSAFICSSTGSDCRSTPIFRTNYHFRGVLVPKGEHTVEFKNTLL